MWDNMKQYKESFYNIEIEKDSSGRILVFNSRRVSLAWFLPEVLNTFKGKEKILSSKIDHNIIDKGFVVENDRDETFEYLFERRRHSFNANPEVLSFVIAPTMSCNYSCWYCFETNRGGPAMDESICDSIELFIKKAIEENTNTKLVHIEWFGGEPLLAIDKIQKISQSIIEICDKKNIKYDAGIVTNGSLLSKGNADLLKKLHVSTAQITLDGLSETYSKTKGCPEGCFSTVIQNIKDIENTFHLSIRVNISKLNYKEIKQLIKYLLIDLNLNVQIYLAPVHAYSEEFEKTVFNADEFELIKKEIIVDPSLGEKQRKIYSELPQRHVISCDAMLCKSFVIDPRGNLYKCTHHLGHSEFSVGDVFNGVLKNRHYYSFVNNELPEKCTRCKVLPVCGGGCILLNKDEQFCKDMYTKIIGSVKLFLLKVGDNKTA